MEVMDMSLDKFYKMLYENGKTVPEDILGKIAVAVSACCWENIFCIIRFEPRNVRQSLTISPLGIALPSSVEKIEYRLM